MPQLIRNQKENNMKSTENNRWSLSTKNIIQNIKKFDEAYLFANTPAERSYAYYALVAYCDSLSKTAKNLADMMHNAAISNLLDRKG